MDKNHELNPNRIDYTLREYQKQTIRQLIKGLQTYGYQHVALDCGLGKTCCSIQIFSKNEKRLPILIVCPSVVKGVWEDEILKFSKYYYKITTLKNNPKTKPQLLEDMWLSEIVIINYDILTKWMPHIIKRRFKMVFLDESHYLKNRTSKRTRATKKIVNSCPYKISISATPLDSKPTDFYPVLNMCIPDLISFREFTNKFCVAEKGFQGRIVYKKCKDKKALNAFLSTYMIRYRRKDINEQLPDVIKQNIPIDITNRMQYNKAKKGLLKFKNGEYENCKDKVSILSRLTQLRLITSEGKLKEGIKWIRNHLETTGEKLVVMGIYKNTLNVLEEEFKNICVKYNGDVSEKQKKIAVERFNSDPSCRLYLGNIISSGTGLSLHRSCSYMLFFDLDYSPTNNKQASDRINRIVGNHSNKINIYYLLAKNTIDTSVVSINNNKNEMISEVIDNEKINYQDIINSI